MIIDNPIEDKNISNLITKYWQLIAQLNEFENVTIYQYKLNIKNLTYKIIDGTKYIDVKNKVINDDATLLTYDNVILKEYNNRLINILRFDTVSISINRFIIILIGVFLIYLISSSITIYCLIKSLSLYTRISFSVNV